jgi:AraC-like DNA-binding protein
VALACGYDSTSAFIAAFRQQFGETPGNFFADFCRFIELAHANRQSSG